MAEALVVILLITGAVGAAVAVVNLRRGIKADQVAREKERNRSARQVSFRI